MAKVTAEWRQSPHVQVNPLLIDTIDQERLWVHYDDEADSMVIYITGSPVFAVSVEIEDDTYIKVDPVTNNIVGFHVEAWTRHFLPNHPDLQAVWQTIETTSPPSPKWNPLLRMVALWMIFMLKSEHSLPSPLPLA